MKKFGIVLFALSFDRTALADTSDTSTTSTTSIIAESHDTSEPILPVEVRARRKRTPDPSASTQTFTREDVREALDRGRELADLLDTAAGVRVIDLGGGSRRASLRAGSPSQMLLVIDGVPIRSAFATGPDLELVDLASVDRVEVLRGGAGASLGDGALTGAVAIDTRRRTRPSLSLGYGSLDTVTIRATQPLPGVALSGSYRRSSGAFDYVSHLEGLPDVAAVRENNDSQSGAVTLGGELGSARWRFPFSAHAAIRESGVAGAENQADQVARETRAIALARAGISSRFFLAAIDASFQRIGYRPAKERSSVTDFVSLDAMAEAEPLDGLVLRAEASRDGAYSSVIGRPARTSAALAALEHAKLGSVGLFLGLRAALRADDADTALELLPRVGATYGTNWVASIGVGRSLRVPTLDERFHPEEAGFEGNPKLAPESAWELEANVRSPSSRDWQLSLSAFGRVVSGAIVYVHRDAFVIRPENVGDAKLAGMELAFDGRLELFGELVATARANAALVASKLEVTSEPLPSQPAATGDLELEIGPPWASLIARVDASTTATANIYATLANDSQARLDLTVVVRPNPSVRASFTLSNVLDDRALSTVFLIPTPGRTAWLTIRAEGI
ncbi:MAG: TonB-dependent receptor [Deltaproteobacteria bacterium]|nr:TonB-dependent receptor [Deltaproteobacteria bacterium]